MAIKIVQHLNWNLQTYKEREEMVNGLIKDGLLDELTPYQLNEVNNYLLYAKDVDVEVKLRNPTKQMVSYEELVENGVAETVLTKQNVSIYKVVKPTIDREKDKDIPGMVELWEAIEIIKRKYDYIRGILKGEIERDFNNPIEPTFVMHNFYRNWYIDLSRNQYYLKDIFHPACFGAGTSFATAHREKDLLGIRADKYILCEGDRMIDFGNPDHIYQMLRYYAHIREKHIDKADDSWNYMYDFLDTIIADMNWSETHWDILENKINGESNEVIADLMWKKHGVHYSVNYISTIFKRHISRDIAKKAIRIAYQWTQRHDKIKWRVCSRCHKKHFYSPEFFGKNKKVCLTCTGKRININKKINVVGLHKEV